MLKRNSTRFTAALVAALISFIAGPNAAPPAAAQHHDQAPGFYRLKVGDLEVTALFDGTGVFDPHWLNGTKATMDGVQEALQKDPHVLDVADTLPRQHRQATNPRRCGRRGLWGGGAFGRLARSLRSAGYPPEDVNIALVTHLHADHVGGLTTEDGKRVFPPADVYVAKAESDFWLSPDVACPVAFAASQHGVSIKVFTSQDDQFWTNAVLIEGAHEVMLVDAQLTKTNAAKVLQAIRETHKPLSLIYITHEHADHFLGLEVFRGAYPRVRIVATSAVVARINQVYREKIDKWKRLLGSSATTHVVPIEPFDGSTITFENSHIEVLKQIQGDTAENTMLWIPGERILVGGDVVFNNMHVYTAETDTQARGKWLNSLNTIRALQPSAVIAGHSKSGAQLDASTAVDFTETYLRVFEEERNKAKDPDGLIKAMKARFPSADLFLAIERGAAANVKP